jgi:hypothetical protein
MYPANKIPVPKAAPAKVIITLAITNIFAAVIINIGIFNNLFL